LRNEVVTGIKTLPYVGTTYLKRKRNTQENREARKKKWMRYAFGVDGKRSIRKA